MMRVPVFAAIALVCAGMQGRANGAMPAASLEKPRRHCTHDDVFPASPSKSADAGSQSSRYQTATLAFCDSIAITDEQGPIGPAGAKAIATAIAAQRPPLFAVRWPVDATMLLDQVAPTGRMRRGKRGLLCSEYGQGAGIWDC